MRNAYNYFKKNKKVAFTLVNRIFKNRKTK